MYYLMFLSGEIGKKQFTKNRKLFMLDTEGKILLMDGRYNLETCIFKASMLFNTAVLSSSVLNGFAIYSGQKGSRLCHYYATLKPNKKVKREDGIPVSW